MFYICTGFQVHARCKAYRRRGYNKLHLKHQVIQRISVFIVLLEYTCQGERTARTLADEIPANFMFLFE